MFFALERLEDLPQVIANNGMPKHVTDKEELPYYFCN